MRLRSLFVILFISSYCFGQYANHAIFGGKTEWKRFLHDHLVYPPADLKEKAEGTVLISFEITKEGKGINPKVVESVSNDIDAEALRLLSLIEWFPPNPEAVLGNSKQSVEINFSVSKYKKWVKERGYDKALFSDLPLDTALGIYEKADKGPSFFSPDKTFQEFIYSTLDYPETARQQGLDGNVEMGFIVEPNGAVSNIRIKNGGVGGGCNEEAIRVMGLTRWKPAIKDNKYVRFRMNYTMNFSVKNTFKDNSSGTQRPFGQ